MFWFLRADSNPSRTNFINTVEENNKLLTDLLMKHVPSVVEKYRLRTSGNDPHTDTPLLVPSHPIAVNQTHFSGLAI